MRAPTDDRSTPLSPVVLHVLLALTDGPLHGYAIMRAAEESSGLVMGPGTVYGSIRRLEKAGWVRELEDVQGLTARKSPFELTEEGRQALRIEARRLDALARLTRAKNLLADGEAG